MKIISSESLVALKNALAKIYWTKKDLRMYLNYTIHQNSIISNIDWENKTKVESVEELIDRMVKRTDIYNDDILRLIESVTNFNDFSHLKLWEDGDSKIAKARAAVDSLRKLSINYFDLLKEKESAERRREAFNIIHSQLQINKDNIKHLYDKFCEINSEENPNKRGFLFEKFLNELFCFFDMNPKESFKIFGEQIDGAFTFDNTDYLLEAKWQKNLVNTGELLKFEGKINGKLKNTLGLFISFNGFSEHYQNDKSIKSIILMDGEDLIAVLDGRIQLDHLLLRKRRHASETGEIYLRFRDM